MDRYICLGDFNCISKVLCQTFDGEAVVYGPRILNNYHSYVFEDRGCQGLDCTLIKVKTYATYDWSFVNQENGYGDKTERDYLNIRGLPDHAILKGMIEL